MHRKLSLFAEDNFVLREEFREVPLDVSVASGGAAELRCAPPRGHPPPTLSWTRNGHEIDFTSLGDR
ncbi:hypothetical protein HAZT_HAZT003468 [Hyalella azteca]|uniref:Ig-like domain-containing protein n=1 Tax=Hyalella azteca TaxID=294128 RepID=A0A6A0GR38_HYAAZ|nr:hypothetical protein HAZT_HAZT003468 [Hyalella azteca]